MKRRQRNAVRRPGSPVATPFAKRRGPPAHVWRGGLVSSAVKKDSIPVLFDRKLPELASRGKRNLSTWHGGRLPTDALGSASLRRRGSHGRIFRSSLRRGGVALARSDRRRAGFGSRSGAVRPATPCCRPQKRMMAGRRVAEADRVRKARPRQARGRVRQSAPRAAVSMAVGAGRDVRVRTGLTRGPDRRETRRPNRPRRPSRNCIGRTP